MANETISILFAAVGIVNVAHTEQQRYRMPDWGCHQDGIILSQFKLVCEDPSLSFERCHCVHRRFRHVGGPGRTGISQPIESFIARQNGHPFQAGPLHSPFYSNCYEETDAKPRFDDLTFNT
jgi:hypothetical protein